jgi:hypothetical protein
MQGTTDVEKVVYQDELFRTYTIFPLNMTLTYSNLKQIATPISDNEIRVSGGTLKINYSFKWEKKQLSSSIVGTGRGKYIYKLRCCQHRCNIFCKIIECDRIEKI